MNVLLVSRCFPHPLHHGDRLIVSHLVEEQRQRGHCLDMAAFYLHERDLDEIPRCRAQVRHFEAVKERPRSWIDYLKRLARPTPRSAGQCWNPAMWRTLEGLLSTRRYHLVHFFGGIQVYEFQKLANHLPGIITPYESFALFLEREVAAATGPLERLRLKTILRVTRRYEKTIYARFDRVVLVSDKDAEYLQALNPRLRTVVIPNGVDLEYFKPRDVSTSDSTLVFLGNYEYGPNVSAAIRLITDILPRVQTHVPKASVKIIGAGPPADLLALRNRDVQVLGWVADVRPHLGPAACLVVPLSRGAGIRNKILEAMASGLPVVSTPLGSEGIDAQPGESILLGKDPDQLARQVIRLLTDESVRVRLSKEGRRLVERLYGWKRVGDDYESLYHQLTTSDRAASEERSEDRRRQQDARNHPCL
jgi:glycosyltransferase involved in cell wall biosynthesis